MSRIKILLLVCMVSVATVCHAQQKISDGTAATAINPNAILDLQSATKGLLLPRVQLTSTTSPSPIPHVNGMVVYNTATAGDVTPGYYYNDGSKWVRLADANASAIPNAWLLGGNSNGALKTIGTNDAFDLPMTVKGTEAMRAIWDATNSVPRIAVGATAAATVASATSGSSAAQQSAELTVSGGDASINGVTVGKGGGQDGSNTALGNQSLYNNKTTTAGKYNTAVGNQSLLNNTDGAQNVGIGFQSLKTNTTGNYNTSVGTSALITNATGSYNVAVGENALYYNTAGNNTALGYQAGDHISTGTDNTTIGYQAGNAITTGTDNIAIGASTNMASNTASNQMNIGNTIFGTGMTGTLAAPAGNIGINTSSPKSTLDVTGNNSSATDITGLQAPRLTRAELTNKGNTLYGANQKGTLVYITDVSGGDAAAPQRINVASPGYYCFDGTLWNKVAYVEPSKYTPEGIYSFSPSAPVTWILSTSYASATTINNIDINNNVNVYVPANTSYLILINYSIPIGLTDATGDFLRAATSGTIYQGIRFLRNTVEAPSGSRKFLQTGVACVSGIYSETYDNTTAAQVTLNYSLQGYLEIAGGTTFAANSYARFNMNKATGANYNWGKAVITIQIFSKPL